MPLSLALHLYRPPLSLQQSDEEVQLRNLCQQQGGVAVVLERLLPLLELADEVRMLYREEVRQVFFTLFEVLERGCRGSVEGVLGH